MRDLEAPAGPGPHAARSAGVLRAAHYAQALRARQLLGEADAACALAASMRGGTPWPRLLEAAETAWADAHRRGNPLCFLPGHPQPAGPPLRPALLGTPAAAAIQQVKGDAPVSHVWLDVGRGRGAPAGAPGVGLSAAPAAMRMS